ncbi:hypothetical protein ACFLS9_00690 [Bacteroidota bacterium]
MENLIYTYLISFVILWTFLLGLTLYQTNRKILERKGYKEDYIEYIRNSNIKRNLGIGIVVPIIGIIAAVIIWLIFGDLDNPDHKLYIFVLWILLIIPFPIIESRSGNKELKDLAIKTSTDIVVDFKYTIIHLVFNPKLEFVSSLIYVIYFVAYVEIFHISFIHILLLWFLYSAVRFIKNLTLPALRDTYKYNFVFMVLNHLLLIYYILREVFTRFSCPECVGSIQFIIGISIETALIIKLIYYTLNYSKFSLRLKKMSSE